MSILMSRQPRGGARAARIAMSALLAAVALAHAHTDDAAQIEVIEVIGDVGDVIFDPGCNAAGAQERFERAVALLHHMTYEVAEREFAAVAGMDPECALPHWGIAMTLVHPLWPGYPSADDLDRGRNAIARARELATKPRDHAYIDALAAFYDDSDTVDHNTRIARWSAAQSELAKRYPADDEAHAFAALLRLAAAPKDDLSYAIQRDVGAGLENLGRRRPRHPAAIHYLIHAYDSPPLAERALEAARRYDAIAPEVPHALHMPSHIFTRLGLWRDSAAWNTRSREAARRLLVDGAIYAEFAHASDYLTYAYLQAGQDEDARKAREVLLAAPRIQDGFVAAYAYAAVATRIEMELGDWEGAAQIAPRQPATVDWDACPACEAMVHFARGVGAARSERLPDARSSVQKLAELAQSLRAQGQDYWARHVQAQRQTVEAWIAVAEGRLDDGLVSMAAAADAEDALDKHPVTPGAIIPARELLADMLFTAGRYDDAVLAYEAALRVSPNRYNSLAGAARAAAAAQRPDEATRYFSRLLEVAPAAQTRRAGLQEARALLRGGSTPE